MERTDVRRYQLAQLAILTWFDDFCKINGLSYYLIYGTLLGAIRHGGFIPWDADVDVAMHRCDYEKFKEMMKTNIHKDLFLDDYTTDSMHTSPHAILRVKETHVKYKMKVGGRYNTISDGIYIDIFPIDNVTGDVKKLDKQIKMIKLYKRIISLKSAPTYGTQTNALKRIGKMAVSALFSPIPFSSIQHRMDCTMQKYNTEITERVTLFPDSKLSTKTVYPRQYFGKPSLVLFESKQFYAPNQPEKILEQYYGDYMQLPAEETRWNYLDSVIDYIDYGDSEFFREMLK